MVIEYVRYKIPADQFIAAYATAGGAGRCASPAIASASS
jgi:hypothetical protein